MGHDVIVCPKCGNYIMEGHNDWDCERCGYHLDFSGLLKEFNDRANKKHPKKKPSKKKPSKKKKA